MIILTCKRVKFFSELDEIAFTERIKKIRCIESYEGISDSVYLKIRSKNISDLCLRELLSLFYRYKINMAQLADFLNEKNKFWFFDEKAFWFNKIFNKKRADN
jgi:hypothetical protein